MTEPEPTADLLAVIERVLDHVTPGVPLAEQLAAAIADRDLHGRRAVPVELRRATIVVEPISELPAALAAAGHDPAPPAHDGATLLVRIAGETGEHGFHAVAAVTRLWWSTT